MKRPTLPLALAFVVVMFLVMRYQGKSLVTPATPLGILDLEFARTGERWQRMVLFLNRGDIVRNLQLDFLFIVSYVIFFITGLRYFGQRNGWTKWPPRFLAMGVAAGFFDVLENFLLMMVLNQRFDTDVLQVVYFVAWIKFVLAAEVLLYLLFCALSRFRPAASGVRP